MAVSEKAINFIQGGLERGKAIPGQSLTNSPDQPYNWERPAEYSNPREAMLYVFETLTVPETTTNVLLSLSNGVGVVDIASITLYAGFLEGKWNPDLLMLMVEPTAYMLLGLAESADIDPVIYRDQQEDEFDEDFDADLNPQQEQYKKLAASLDMGKIDKVLPQEIVEQIEDVPTASLMQAPVEPAVEAESLLTPPPVEEEEV